MAGVVPTAGPNAAAWHRHAEHDIMCVESMTGIAQPESKACNKYCSVHRRRANSLAYPYGR